VKKLKSEGVFFNGGNLEGLPNLPGLG